MMQYYGILADRKTAVFVAMTKEKVIEYAINNPHEKIVYLADKFNILYAIDYTGKDKK